MIRKSDTCGSHKGLGMHPLLWYWYWKQLYGIRPTTITGECSLPINIGITPTQTMQIKASRGPQRLGSSVRSSLFTNCACK